jgi:CheY-like chemotaxis protein
MSSQTRVLVVDDEPAIRNSLVEFLKIASSMCPPRIVPRAPWT